MIKITKRENGTRRVQTFFHDEEGKEIIPSKTEQCHAKECDIKNIIKTYDKTGLILQVDKAAAKYGDFTLVNEFKEAQDFVLESQRSFMEMPSRIRNLYDNDPGKFYEFATNPENHEEMVKMGLALPKTPVESTTKPKANSEEETPTVSPPPIKDVIEDVKPS